MTIDDITSFLDQQGVRYDLSDIQYGKCVRTTSGEVVNIYDSGKCVVQGKNTALKQELQALTQSGMMPAPASGGAQPPGTASPPNLDIFVVYGHDVDARNALELMLRRMGLNPIILAQLPSDGDTIIEKLEKYLRDSAGVGYACVLLTPDDEGHRSGADEEKRYRARQNVILELGMVLARVGRQRVSILYKGSVERPSDIDGLIYLPFEERVEEVGPALFKNLDAAGYAPKSGAL